MLLGGSDDLFGPDAQISYSQEGEDRLLRRLLENRPTGFYVDVGAHHPTRFSNTALLYGDGWRGINIDPNPGSRREFARRRPDDINLELAVGDTGAVTYFVFDEPALSTVSAERATFLEATTPYRIVDSIQVQVHPLAEILDRYLPAGQRVDLLTVDVEGVDLQVLRSNDWTRFRPDYVVAEDLNLRLRELTQSPIVNFLDEQGFEPIAKTVNSVFFADTSTR